MTSFAIDLQNVTVLRGNRKILRDISWQVPAGSVAAIVGPNGSGKSTLARVIMGQMWPTRGHVRVLGEPFGETDLNALRESIRLVQPTGAVDLDDAESALNITLSGFFGTVGLYRNVTPAMRSAATTLLKRVGLARQMLQPYRTLSNGERIRCLIARALVVKPELLILDEPTAGLDLLAREQVLATVQQLVERSKTPPTILMITHHLEELLPKTDSVLLLKDGKVAAAGPPAAVLTGPTMSAVYDFPITVSRRGGRFWVRVDAGAWENLV